MSYVVLLVVEFENCPLTYALFFQNFCCQSKSRKSKVYWFAGETSLEIILFNYWEVVHQCKIMNNEKRKCHQISHSEGISLRLDYSYVREREERE